jgi:hypothetical protein
MEPQPPSEIEAQISEAQLQKLELEITSLRWQNSILGRLNQLATIVTVFATIVTIAATLFGLWQGYETFVANKQKENDLKARELTEGNNRQYRSELQQLIQYPSDPTQTIPSAVFLLQDIQDVIENGYKDNQEGLQKRRDQVGFLLAQLIRSPGYDFNSDRNVEFDRKAMNYSDYYANYLINHPGENMDIISRYTPLLESISDSDPKFYMAVVRDADDTFHEVNRKPAKDVKKFFIFTLLFHGINKHVELLNKSPQNNQQDIDALQRNKQHALCLYYNATQNRVLTKNIFNVSDGELDHISDTMCDQY